MLKDRRIVAEEDGIGQRRIFLDADDDHAGPRRTPSGMAKTMLVWL